MNSGELSHDETTPARGNPGVNLCDSRPTLHLENASAGQLKISETFVSRQGEGKLTGTDCFFLRISGCNLRCHFCDTPYASWNPGGTLRSIGSLLDEIEASGLRHVVLTGGEPLLPPAIETLCHELHARKRHITIETAGTIDRDLPCDLMSISPKLSASTPDSTEHPRWATLHQQRRLPIKIMQKLVRSAKDFQIKFVVSNQRELTEIGDVVKLLEVEPGDVWLMPEGTTAEKMIASRQWMQPKCRELGFHFCDRMQIHWYGNRRGT